MQMLTRSNRIGLLALGLALTLSVGCQYQGHRNFGATERFADSDINRPTKLIGTVPLALGDAIASPFTAWSDMDSDSGTYHEDHKYLSYAGSRSIARSDMSLEYQWIASLFAIPIETIYLIPTGIVDIVTILND